MRNPYKRIARYVPSRDTMEFALIAAGVGVAITTVVDQVGSDLNVIIASMVPGLY